MNKENYILTRKANGDTRTVTAIGDEFDAIYAELNPAPAPVQPEPENEPGISDLVSEWLKSLAAEEFESIRKESYKTQYEQWNAAGRIGEA